MKAYVCDICSITIDDPHTLKMKEFYWDLIVENSRKYALKAKRKKKLHLCGNCFEGLKSVFAKLSEDEKRIVHCKNCEYLTEDGLCFKNINGVGGYKKTRPDDFCSYGRRKDETSSR